MYKKNIYPIIILSGILFSCNEIQFEPSEVNKIAVKIPETVNYRLVFENAGDTLVLWAGLTLKYEIIPETTEQVLLEFYIDGQMRTETDNSENITFKSDYWWNYYLIPGLHFLKVILYVPTGSGSIAGRLNSEFYYSEFEWPAYLDNRTIEVGREIVNFVLVDSNLKITWVEYPYYNFQEYRLFKASKTLAGEFLDTLVTVIKQRERHFFIDSTYNENSRYYRVDLLAKNTLVTGNYKNFP